MERGREGSVRDGTFCSEDRRNEVHQKRLFVLLDEGEGGGNRPFGAERGENDAVQALLDRITDGALKNGRTSGSYFGVGGAENAIDGREKLSVRIARKGIKRVEEEKQLRNVGIVRENDDPEDINGLQVREIEKGNVNRDGFVACSDGHGKLCALYDSIQTKKRTVGSVTAPWKGVVGR